MYPTNYISAAPTMMPPPHRPERNAARHAAGNAAVGHPTYCIRNQHYVPSCDNWRMLEFRYYNSISSGFTASRLIASVTHFLWSGGSIIFNDRKPHAAVLNSQREPGKANTKHANSCQCTRAKHLTQGPRACMANAISI